MRGIPRTKHLWDTHEGGLMKIFLLVVNDLDKTQRVRKASAALGKGRSGSQQRRVLKRDVNS